MKYQPVEQNLHMGKECPKLTGASPKQLIPVSAPIPKRLPSLALLFCDDRLLDQLAKDVASARLPQIPNSAECP